MGDCARRNHRAEEAGFAVQLFENFRFGGESVISQPAHLRKFDFVDGVIAANQRQHEAISGHHRNRLHRAIQRNAKQRGHVFAGLLDRRLDPAHCFAARRTLTGRNRFGGFKIGRVTGPVGMISDGIGDRILPRFRQHMEFL